MHCGCVISQTCPPWAPFLMCFCVPLSLGRLGPARAEVGVGFRRVRLVQALPSFHPSTSLVPLSVGHRFSFPCLFRVCPFRARCVMLVFFLSLFFCVPFFASCLGNVHFIFIVTWLSFSFHLPRHGGACVCTIWIDVKLLILQGVTGVPGGSVTNEDTSPEPVQT